MVCYLYFQCFFVSFFACFLLIKFFDNYDLFQPERSEIIQIRGNSKRVPTAGGLAIFTSLALIFYAFSGANLAILLLGISYAVLGFIDDYLKLKKQKYNGLLRNYRLICEILIAAIFVNYIIWLDSDRNNIPIIGDIFTLFNIMWGIWIILSCANSMNLTDGIDALASSLVIYVFLFLFLTVNHSLSIPIICAILGFLCFNRPPAKIIMGDTGSLGIGALMGGCFYQAKMELWLLLIGIVFIIETLSVIIQIYYIRKLKNKFFLMAPIHHHFELLGWKRNNILILFNFIGIVAMIFGVILYDIGFGSWNCWPSCHKIF